MIWDGKKAQIWQEPSNNYNHFREIALASSYRKTPSSLGYIYRCGKLQNEFRLCCSFSENINFLESAFNHYHKELKAIIMCKIHYKLTQLIQITLRDMERDLGRGYLPTVTEIKLATHCAIFGFVLFLFSFEEHDSNKKKKEKRGVNQ